MRLGMIALFVGVTLATSYAVDPPATKPTTAKAPPTAASMAADAAFARYNVAAKAADEARERALKAPRETLVKDLQAALQLSMKAGDLMTSNQINEKLTAVKAGEIPGTTDLASRFVGKWVGKGWSAVVYANGTIKHSTGTSATWKVDGDHIVSRWSNGIVETVKITEIVRTSVDGKPWSEWVRE